MTLRRLLIALLLVAIGASIVWGDFGYVDAYFSNHIGAPGQEETDPFSEPDDTVTLRLAVAGDVGTGGRDEYLTAAAMDALESRRGYDALLLLGDNVYASSGADQIDVAVFDPFALVLDGDTDLLAVLGNHDLDNGNGPEIAQALGMPNSWYVTTIGNTSIIALDSNQASNPEQLSWLQATLEDTASTWTIAIMHHPAYSAGWHGSTKSVQANFVPLFEEYGVNLAFSGHDHDYQRTEAINGVTYVVTGAAAKLRPAGYADFTEVAWSTHSFVDLAIYTDRIALQAVNHDGRVIDSFTLPAD